MGESIVGAGVPVQNKNIFGRQAGIEGGRLYAAKEPPFESMNSLQPQFQVFSHEGLAPASIAVFNADRLDVWDVVELFTLDDFL